MTFIIGTLLFLVTTSAGCQRQKSESAPTLVTHTIQNQSVDGVNMWQGYAKEIPTLAKDNPSILPAFELPFERKLSGKSDQYDDFRAQYKEWFAITIPPSQVQADIHGMVEWEDMQALLLSADGQAYSSSIDQNIADLAWSSIHLAGVETYVMYTDTGHKNAVLSKFNAYGPTAAESDMLNWVYVTTGSIWMIDYGPISFKDNNDNVAFADFRYYHYRVWDDALSTRLGEDVFDVDTFRIPISMEGGNLQMDSMGTCYMTQGVLWANPVPEPILRQTMKDYLGCEQLVILAPLAEEGTHHVDMFFKLVDDHTVILGDYTWNQDSQNAELLDANEDILNAVVLPDGQGLNVVRMPMPSNSNQSVWRTYINATFIAGPNGKVNAWPTYNIDESLEDQAEAIWQATMPDWTHNKLPSDSIITIGGAIHCISRTIPEGNLNRWVPGGSCAGSQCNAGNSNSYDGSCGVETGCNGPKWLCDSNDCGTPCAGVTWEGCCDNNVLYSCEAGSMVTYNCSSSGTCGWDSQNDYYNCGKEGEGPVQFPIDCPWNDCEPQCDGKNCGSDGCGGTCGTCSDGQECNAGTCETTCVPSCEGLSCGDDGCGGSCGDCGFNQVCAGGSCVLDPGCEGFSYEGCCDDGVVHWCENGEKKTYDCGSVDNCGWNGAQNYYWCGADDTPPEEFPLECGTCTPSCDGLSCGDDGCGGSCGTCDSGSTCLNGACVCTPQCDGLECGDDGCGGTCGTCDGGSVCEDGVCGCAPQCDGKECGSDGCGGSCGSCDSGDECTGAGLCAPPSEVCGGVGPEGLCQDKTLLTCNANGAVQMTECDTCCGVDPVSQKNACLDQSLCACEPSCQGKQCGSDGCGGSCGDCVPGTSCNNGVCGCVADCFGKSCGDDGCGGSCGSCDATDACSEGLCVCAPDCRFKECGNDGCGGSCGDCGGGESCQQGACAPGSGLGDNGPSTDTIQNLPRNTGTGTGGSSGCTATPGARDTRDLVYWSLLLWLIALRGRRRELAGSLQL